MQIVRLTTNHCGAGSQSDRPIGTAIPGTTRSHYLANTSIKFRTEAGPMRPTSSLSVARSPRLMPFKLLVPLAGDLAAGLGAVLGVAAGASVFGLAVDELLGAVLAALGSVAGFLSVVFSSFSLASWRRSLPLQVLTWSRFIAMPNSFCTYSCRSTGLASFPSCARA